MYTNVNHNNNGYGQQQEQTALRTGSKTKRKKNTEKSEGVALRNSCEEALIKRTTTRGKKKKANKTRRVYVYILQHKSTG